MDNSGAVETFESQPAVVATQVLPPEEAIKLEELEAVMKQLQADLHEARSRNIYLTGLIEDQKRLAIMFLKDCDSMAFVLFIFQEIGGL